MRFWLSLVCYSIVGIPIQVTAQIIPDATLPQNSQTNINGSVIDISGGTVAGENLFHSFTQFSLLTGDTANFNNSASIQNIISRVTGNSLSDIDGLVRANGTANLFLINPNGIIFGENAALDIGGSFLGSTAERVNFADGTEFSAVSADSESLLTVSIPLGLQYGNNPGDIEVRGTGNNLSIDPETFLTNRSDRPTGLEVNPDRTLALIGGNVSLTGGNLTAVGGNVTVGSLSSGLVTFTSDNSGWSFNYDRDNSFQDITFTQAASIEASGVGGGNVELQGRNIRILNGSAILADTLEDEPGGLLLISASDTVEVLGSADNNFFTSRLSTDVDLGAGGSGGDLTVESDRLILADGGQINVGTFGAGSGGNLTIQTQEIELIGESASTGLASGLFAQPDFGNTGDGGNLTIDTNSLVVADGAQISTTTFGAGNAGDLNLTAETIELIGFSASSPSIIAINAEAQGNAGRLNLATDSLSIVNGAQIATSAFASGNAGILEIDADEIILSAGSPLSGSSGLFNNAETNSTGNSGQLTVNTNSLSLDRGAQIASLISGVGDAGSLDVTANNIVLRGTSPGGTPSGIFTTFFSPKPTVAANTPGISGNLTVKTNTLEILAGAQIATSTLLSRNAGNLTVEANESIKINGTSMGGSSGLFANALESDGSGGNLTVITELLELSDNATISVGNFPSNSNSELASGQGAAGNLFIWADRLNLDRGATLSADTFTGDRGNIAIETNLLFLSDRSSISTNAQSAASGGNISLDAEDGFLVAAPQGNSDITANAVFGEGGRVDVNALRIIGIEPRLQLTPLSDITASSEFGIAGNIVLNTQGFELNRDLPQLPNNFIAPNLDRGCQSGADNDRSSFVNIGQGGFKPQPTELLESDDYLDDVLTPKGLFDSGTSSANSDSASEEEILEAQSWIVNRQGKIELVINRRSPSGSLLPCELSSVR